MAKWASRGRPKSARADGKDRGTPELQKRKNLGLLSEPVDLCREKGIINADEHWCALHLRWLYTLRYGLPTVTATNLERFGGSRIDESDEWNSHRELEFHEAIEALKKCGAHKEIINLAIMNIYPVFLISCNEHSFRAAEASLAKVKSGLEELCNLWIKGRRRTIRTAPKEEAPEEPQCPHR